MSGYLISEHMVCKTVFGSHLYGTQTPSSDRDLKGIFVPSTRDVLLGRIPKTAPLTEVAVDGNLFSLHSFLHLAVQGQTVAIDMLWTPPSLTERGPYAWIWDMIVANRTRLLSRSMNAFVGYARGQAAKYSLKGSRLEKLVAFRDKLEGTCPDLNLATYWDILPRDAERTNPAGVPELQIAGKWFGSTTAVRFVTDVIDRSIDRYGERAREACEAGGTDWKALSHAVRVSKELKELLTEGDLAFPLRDRELLLRIKKGEVEMQQVQDLLDQDLLEIEILSEQSPLPEKVDVVWWDQFLFDIVSECVSRSMLSHALCPKT